MTTAVFTNSGMRRPLQSGQYVPQPIPDSDTRVIAPMTISRKVMIAAASAKRVYKALTLRFSLINSTLWTIQAVQAEWPVRPASAQHKRADPHGMQDRQEYEQLETPSASRLRCSDFSGL